MKRILSVFPVLFVLGSFSFAGEPAPGGEAPAWMEKFQPGKEHEAFKKLEGSYDVAVKMWEDPTKPPTESKATAEFKMVLNGRWLKLEYKGEIMGKLFTGLGYDGFDRTTGKYVSVWMDDFSTTMMHSTGTSKDSGKTIEYTGEMGCPMEEGKVVKTRQVHKEESADKFIFEMYMTIDGKEMKGMELTYTRKK